MKHTFLVISLLILGYITSAYTLEEFTFKDQGYEDFYIRGFGSYDCKRYDFVLASDLNAEVFPVFSLDYEFLPKPGKEAGITVYLNGDNAVAELGPGTAPAIGKKARIWLPKEKLWEENNLRVCGKTSFTANQVRIGSASTLGVYTAPYFPPETGFRLELDSRKLTIGEAFTIHAVARNHGSEDAEVRLTYRRSQLEENTPEVTILSGETTSTGTAPKCARRNETGECIEPGEYRIGYTAVANRAVPFSLLPAIMEHENIFGETILLESDRPEVEAFEPEHTLSAQVFLGKDAPLAGETIPVSISVKNNGKLPVYNAVVSLKTGLEIIGEESKTMGVVEPGKTERAEFSAKGLTKGEYTLGCELSYNEKLFECTRGRVSLAAPRVLTNELLFGLAFVLLALAAFSYYYFKKG